MKPWQQVAALSLPALLVLASLWWQAGDFTVLWLTPDQRGRLAYERRDFAAAEAQFADPMWIGSAGYAAGNYDEAASTFARVTTAAGFYNRGNALLKGAQYAPAVSAFELAVAEAPDWRQARHNLRLARHILAYLDRTREETGTGGKLGADEYRFDNNRERGEETTITDQSTIERLSAEKWMRSVNTRTSEFLRTRFLLETSRKNPQ